MKTVAFGLAALIGLVLPAAAGSKDQIQLAQASAVAAAVDPARPLHNPAAPAARAAAAPRRAIVVEPHRSRAKARPRTRARSPAIAKAARAGATPCGRRALRR